MLAILLSLILTVQTSSPAGGDGFMLGTQTAYSAALIGSRAGAFQGVQLTRRDGRLCQVRSFFRGESPRIAEFCAGRVVGRHVSSEGLAVIEHVSGVSTVSACFGPAGQVQSLRLTGAAGEEATGMAGDCGDTYQDLSCAEGWVVQGLYLYFDGPADGMRHRRLVGLRPLCAQV